MIDPEELQAKDIHLPAGAAGDVRSQLEEAKQAMRVTAVVRKVFVLINHEEENGKHQIRARGVPEKDFSESVFQCPRAADIEFQKQAGIPRPFPSMMATPAGEIVVSKPELCDDCTWRLFKGVNGNCDGKRYERR